MAWVKDYLTENRNRDEGDVERSIAELIIDFGERLENFDSDGKVSSRSVEGGHEDGNWSGSGDEQVVSDLDVGGLSGVHFAPDGSAGVEGDAGLALAGNFGGDENVVAEVLLDVDVALADEVDSELRVGDGGDRRQGGHWDRICMGEGDFEDSLGVHFARSVFRADRCERAGDEGEPLDEAKDHHRGSVGGPYVNDVISGIRKVLLGDGGAVDQIGNPELSKDGGGYRRAGEVYGELVRCDIAAGVRMVSCDAQDQRHSIAREAC